MRLFISALLFLQLSTGVFANHSLDHARQAQALLGPCVWSRVIQIENPSRSGGYPKEFHATVFELEGILWFYTDYNGTQSMSEFAGRAEQDKAALGALLKTIAPGFIAWKEEPDLPLGRAEPSKLPPNGCMVESIALLRQRMALGGETLHPRLLFYYVKTPAGLLGHTVLAFETARGFRVIDPESPSHSVDIGHAVADAPSLARSLRPDIATARWLAIRDVHRFGVDGLMADASRPASPAPAKPARA